MSNSDIEQMTQYKNKSTKIIERNKTRCIHKIEQNK